MMELLNALYRNRKRIAVGGLLVTASVISLILDLIHTRINGSNYYAFLVVNLGLAWIPFIAAIVAYLTSRNRATFFLIMPFCTLIWLVFFPNAPYLLTDFQHLVHYSANVPVWFDVILLLWFAWTGLLLGISSLYLMQAIVARVFNRAISWVFAIGVASLSSLGVYLGRFLRWNSWDLLQYPLPIAKDMYSIMRHPIANLPTYTFTILFTLLFLFIYLAFHLFSDISRENMGNKD